MSAQLRLDRRAIAGVVVLAIGLAAASTLGVAALSRGFGSVPSWFGAIRCADPRLPAHVVRVDLADMGAGMMSPRPMMAFMHTDPTTVPAGRVSFLVRNRGRLAHELLVLPLPAGGPGTRPVHGDGRIDESRSLGEASRSCGEGAGDGLAPGSKGWLTLSLPAGRYELVCNEPWHYAAGMFDVLSVRAR